jgi:hypothetical protein
MPLKSDSVKTALYASGVLSTGGANYQQRDGFNAFVGSLYRTQNFSSFQAFYGVTGSLGIYHIKSYGFTPSGGTGPGVYYDDNKNLNDSLLTVRSGGKFFGSFGVTGGIAYVVPFPGGGEWRFLGVEVNWQREFGDYLSFRNSLPDTAANLIDKHNNYFTLAIGTDIMGRTRNGSIGYKIAAVFAPRRLTQFDKNRRSFSKSSGYWSNTFHVTVKRVTGFTQLNFGTYAIDWQLGLNFRL